jgi:uncharacterized protein (TIGR03437 family)
VIVEATPFTPGITVTANNTPLTLASTALVYAGEYQLNVQLPENLPAGDYRLTIAVPDLKGSTATSGISVTLPVGP